MFYQILNFKNKMNTFSKVLIDSDKNMVAVISSSCQNIEDAAYQAITKHLSGEKIQLKFEKPCSGDHITPIKATVESPGPKKANTYQFYLILRETYN